MRSPRALVCLPALAAFVMVGALYAVDSPESPKAVAAAPAPPARTQPFILGADISYVPQDEAAGATYWDNGVKMDIFAILKKYKFNYVRIRTFVDVTAPDGYALGKSQPFCDLAHTEAMAKRAQAAGFKILLALHFSDTFSSPGHQAKPVAWDNLAFPALTQALHDYCYKVVAALVAQGTPPAMVQVGNEITDGILYPDGQLPRHWDNFATLLKAAIAGVHAAAPHALIMLQNHLGRSNEAMVPWVDGLISRGVPFDVIGMTCYAEGHKGTDWKTNFTDLARRYPDKFLVAAEYSAQKRTLNDLLYNLPDQRGLGSFIWEPTRRKEALFDKNGTNAGSQTITDDLAELANITGNPHPQPTNGGRYDTNKFVQLYPKMAHDYVTVAPVAAPAPIPVGVAK